MQKLLHGEGHRVGSHESALVKAFVLPPCNTKSPVTLFKLSSTLIESLQGSRLTCQSPWFLILDLSLAQEINLLQTIYQNPS